jgi:hypothetical protein
MSWITITDAQILGKSAGAEVEAARSAALATGQADPVPGIVAQIVREVRGYVAGCDKNTLGPEGTIPDELLGAALNRIRFECATRLPGGALLDEDRRQSNRDALAMLRDAAACRLALAQPATATTEQIAGGNAVQLVSSTPRVASRERIKGL